jgi:RNA polymerase sigma factor (sigma-70 family)
LNRLSEKILVGKCMLGNSKAQKELYDLFSKDMFRVCLSYAPDKETANDLLIEGFMKVFENIHKYKVYGSLGGWIRKIFINHCIDAYRSDRWNRGRVSFEDHITFPNSTNDCEMNTCFDTEHFIHVLNQLPEGYRLVLNLYFLEEYTHKEIANKLNITEGTSKSQLFKAKRYLKEYLINNLSAQELTMYGGLVKEVV